LIITQSFHFEISLEHQKLHKNPGFISPSQFIPDPRVFDFGVSASKYFRPITSFLQHVAELKPLFVQGSPVTEFSFDILPLRFDHVSVATVYSKTHRTKRILTATELLSALDAPALVSKKASDNQKKEWSRELSVPCKVRAEVLNLVYQVLNPTEKRTNERVGGSPETLSGNDSSSPARKRARK